MKQTLVCMLVSALCTSAHAAQPPVVEFGTTSLGIQSASFFTLNAGDLAVTVTTSPDYCGDYHDLILHGNAAGAYLGLISLEKKGVIKPGMYSLQSNDRLRVVAYFSRLDEECNDLLTSDPSSQINAGWISITSISETEVVGSVDAASTDGRNHVKGNFVAALCDWHRHGSRFSCLEAPPLSRVRRQ